VPHWLVFSSPLLSPFLDIKFSMLSYSMLSSFPGMFHLLRTNNIIQFQFYLIQCFSTQRFRQFLSGFPENAKNSTFRFRQVIWYFQEVPRIEKGWKTLDYNIKYSTISTLTCKMENCLYKLGCFIFKIIS